MHVATASDAGSRIKYRDHVKKTKGRHVYSVKIPYQKKKKKKATTLTKKATLSWGNMSQSVLGSDAL